MTTWQFLFLMRIVLIVPIAVSNVSGEWTVTAALTAAKRTLIGATKDVSEELGLELHSRHETEATAEIFNDLRLEKSLHPLERLFRGKWA